MPWTHLCFHALDSASCNLPSVEGALDSASCNLPSVEGRNLALNGLSCNLPAIEGPSSLLCSVSDWQPPVNSPSPVVKQIPSLLCNSSDECKVRPTVECVTSRCGDSVGTHLSQLVARDPSLPESSNVSGEVECPFSYGFSTFLPLH